MTEVQNWAMQNAKWRLFNLLIELLTPDQMEYSCSNGRTIFENIALLLRLSLMNSKEPHPDKSRMTAVKTYVHTYLFPKLVNKTLGKMSASKTLMYLDVIDQVQQIDNHIKFYKEVKLNHCSMVQRLHRQLLDCGGVQMDPAHVDEYEVHFIFLFETFQQLKPESHRRDGLQLFRRYLQIFYDSVLMAVTDLKERDRLLRRTKFMTHVTGYLAVSLSDFHDSIREEAANLLVCMTERFLPPEISMDQDQLEKLTMIKANIVHGLSANMGNQLKDQADLESSNLDYLFKDAVSFMTKVVQSYLDERSVREPVMQFFKLLSVATPFLLINDFRLAKATNSPQRVEILKQILSKM